MEVPLRRKAPTPVFSSVAHLGATLLCGLIIAAGIVGVLIPVIPGLLLSWLGVLLWTFIGGAGSSKYVFLVIATIVALLGAAIKYALPGRNMKASGVRTTSIMVGGLLGIIGFFVIPVI